MENESLNKIIKEIRIKRELKYIDEQAIISTIEKLKKKYPNIINARPKEIKQFVKEARAELRKLSGRFQADFVDLQKLSGSEIKEILKLHYSTKERMQDYSMLKDVLKKLNVRSILDIGCGINPLAFASSDYFYNACDINSADLNLLRKFFKIKGIRGRVFTYDIRNIKKSELPQSDLCVLWKLFDVIEQKGHKKAEQIIKALSCRYLWISFSTRTLSGKPMRHPQRGWIEKLLSRLCFSYLVIKTKNEVFYVASKEGNLPYSKSYTS